MYLIHLCFELISFSLIKKSIIYHIIKALLFRIFHSLFFFSYFFIKFSCHVIWQCGLLYYIRQLIKISE